MRALPSFGVVLAGLAGVVGWLAPRPGSWLSSRDCAVAFPLAMVEPLSPAGAVASSATGAVSFSPVAASSEV